MNLSVTCAWRKGDFESVFRINCTKALINFIILSHQILCITNKKQCQRCVAAEKNQDQKGNDRILN